METTQNTETTSTTNTSMTTHTTSMTQADRNVQAHDNYNSNGNESNENNNTTSSSSSSSPPPPIYRFVMTGGPCGGKTTALARVFMYLRERGFEVVTCPEAFTMLMSNGMNFDFFSVQGMGKHLQGAVLDIQMTLENSVYHVLQARGKPAVILSDRGSMDGSVYTSGEEFEQIMAERHTDRVTLRDNRYDAVFHLVTAADGAEPFYTLANNQVRTESVQAAMEVDRKTQNAWVGHPHLYVIDNSTDFEGKMSRLIDVISKIVGLPSNLRRRSAKFLLKYQPQQQEADDITKCFPPDIDYQVFDVEKVYLKQTTDPTTAGSSTSSSNNNYSFIRCRTHVDANGAPAGSVYQLTTVTFTATGTQQKGSTTTTMVEQKRIISEREYRAAFQARDETRHIVQQRRISFLYAKQSFTIHIYRAPVDHLMILHAQVEAKGDTDDEEPPVTLPPFLPVERRLTNDKADETAYGAYSISLKR